MKQSVTSFQNIYRRYAPDVYRFAYWLCADPDLAKDLTSETFIRLWTTKTKIRVETVKAYLFTITRNLFLQSKRNVQKMIDLNHEIVDGTATADVVAEKRGELRKVSKKMQRLPEIDRAALILRVWEEMPYPEIARILGLTVSAAKVKVHRARQKLMLDDTTQEDIAS